MCILCQILNMKCADKMVIERSDWLFDVLVYKWMVLSVAQTI